MTQDKGAEVARLRALLAKATPGPYTASASVVRRGSRILCQVNAADGNLSIVDSAKRGEANAALIAEALNALPALLALAEAVEGARAAATLVVDGALPATASGHTCFVPRYAIDKLREAIRLVPAGEG